MARLLGATGLVGCHRRRRGLTRRDPQAAPAPDLVLRRFMVDQLDRVWTANITYTPTWSGWLYLAVVLDIFSRRVVGWAMAEHLRALGQRTPVNYEPSHQADYATAQPLPVHQTGSTPVRGQDDHAQDGAGDHDDEQGGPCSPVSLTPLLEVLMPIFSSPSPTSDRDADR